VFLQRSHQLFHKLILTIAKSKKTHSPKKKGDYVAGQTSRHNDFTRGTRQAFQRKPPRTIAISRSYLAYKFQKPIPTMAKVGARFRPLLCGPLGLLSGGNGTVNILVPCPPYPINFVRQFPRLQKLVFPAGALRAPTVRAPQIAIGWELHF
jgi:hypothetical protein